MRFGVMGKLKRHLCLRFSMVRGSIFLFLFGSLGGLYGCSSGAAGVRNDQGTIFVSIAPLRYLVERIADTTFNVEVLVPETTSPESYEPTMQQVRLLSGARGYVAVGLIDFEHSLRGGVAGVSDSLRYLDLSQGLDLVQGVCSHVGHSHNSSHDAHGGHGADPHIWLSPRMLGQMAGRVAEMLVELSPGDSTFYRQNLAALQGELDSLDRAVVATFEGKNERSFAIAHPSLTYYARDYGLQQLAIEVEGKEPSVRGFKELVALLRSRGVDVVFYQRQVSGRSAEVLAAEVGGAAVEFDPLAENVVENIGYITQQLNKYMK